MSHRFGPMSVWIGYVLVSVSRLWLPDSARVLTVAYLRVPLEDLKTSKSAVDHFIYTSYRLEGSTSSHHVDVLSD